MFEFLFKYPRTVFSKGSVVFVSPWPLWALAVAILACAALLGFWLWRQRTQMSPGIAGWRPAAVWLLQASIAALLLVMLWHPAISVATLKPQQNIVAVVVDDSRSMSISEDGKTRLERARSALNGGLVSELEKKFQVRLYRFGQVLERVQKVDQIDGAAESTRIGDALKQVAAEATSLPIGAMVLVSDGADNSGGIDLETIAEIKRHKIPVHTVGIGRDRMERDIEITDATVPARTLAGSRVNAQVTLRQRGYENQKARLVISESGKTLASQEVTLRGQGQPQTESVLFNAGTAGAKTLDISIQQLDGEENTKNNSLARLINVESSKLRILYIEGDPRWELKYVRRALEDDRSVQIASMVRTTQNKIYRQGIDESKELEQGFPTTAEELFAFQGLIIGDVEAAYFTPAQQELIRQFADRRGGGILFLGGRETLADGGYVNSPLAELLPVSLPSRKDTFHRDDAKFELTAAGRDSLICRLLEQPDKNAERWEKMPALADYQEVGEKKPGAVVLAEAVVAGKGRSPLLVTENYGSGRTALFATGGSWRWQMLQDHTDMTHETFWRQLARWLVSESPNPVSVTTPHQVLADEGLLKLRAEVRDKAYTRVSDAKVEAHILGPDGASSTLDLTPSQTETGIYEGEWNAEKPGSYLVEVTGARGSAQAGRDVLTFRRENGVAENFRTEQNRELLQKLADETGGRYYQPTDLARLPQEVSYSEAGITTREVRDLWDMPALFLLLILLRAGEWLVRRKWGAV
jgi:uncharacterized membrane protein